MPIYFLQAGAGGPVKIGYSAMVSQRVSEFQCGNHEPLTILREIAGSRLEESWLHRYFRDSRLSGEWFLFAPEMLTITIPPDFKSWKFPKRTVAAPASKDGASFPALEEAIRIVGSRAALARMIGRPASSIQYWLSQGRIPRAEDALAIQRAVRGRISKARLAPHAFAPQSRVPQDAAE